MSEATTFTIGLLATPTAAKPPYLMPTFRTSFCNMRSNMPIVGRFAIALTYKCLIFLCRPSPSAHLG
ncbi:MAG: hypothetical protein AB4426_20685 [Xenococcaceae cyanobacterium]